MSLFEQLPLLATCPDWKLPENKSGIQGLKVLMFR